MLSTPSHQFGFQWCHSGTSSLLGRGGGGYDMMPELGTSDPHGMFSHIYRVRLNSGWFLFPSQTLFTLGLISFWWITAAQMLQLISFFFLWRNPFLSSWEGFFIFSIIFLPPKENIGAYVPSWLWLASVDSSVLRVVGPSPPVLYQTLLGTWCSTVI